MDRYKNKALTLHRYGSRHTFFVFSLGVVLLLFWLKAYEDALIFLITFSATMGTVVILKVLFRVPRPEGSDLENGSYAFPSGHSAGIFFLATILSSLAYTYLNNIWSALILVALFATALLIGLSRIVLNVHTKVQVIAGAAIGFFVSILIILNKEAILTLIF